MFLPIVLLLTGHCGPGFQDQILLIEVQNADVPSIESSESLGPQQLSSSWVSSWHPSAVVQFQGKNFVGIPFGAIDRLLPELQYIGSGILQSLDLGHQFMDYVVSRLQPPVEPQGSDTDTLMSSWDDWDENRQRN